MQGKKSEMGRELAQDLHDLAALSHEQLMKKMKGAETSKKGFLADVNWDEGAEKGKLEVRRKDVSANSAQLTLSYVNPQSKHDGLEVKLRFKRPPKGHLVWNAVDEPWKLFESIMRKEYETRLKTNEPDRQRIQQAIELTGASREVVHTSNVNDRTIKVVLTLQNRSPNPIVKWDGVVELKDSAGVRLRLFPVQAKDIALAAGAAQPFPFEFSVSALNPNDAYLCASQTDDMKAALWINNLAFASAEPIHVTHPTVLGEKIGAWDLMRTYVGE
jgi:hypothetical protein